MSIEGSAWEIWKRESSSAGPGKEPEVKSAEDVRKEGRKSRHKRRLFIHTPSTPSNPTWDQIPNTILFNVARALMTRNAVLHRIDAYTVSVSEIAPDTKLAPFNSLPTVKRN